MEGCQRCRVARCATLIAHSGSALRDAVVDQSPSRRSVTTPVLRNCARCRDIRCGCGTPSAYVNSQDAKVPHGPATASSSTARLMRQTRTALSAIFAWPNISIIRYFDNESLLPTARRYAWSGNPGEPGPTASGIVEIFQYGNPPAGRAACCNSVITAGAAPSKRSMRASGRRTQRAAFARRGTMAGAHWH